MPSGCPTDSSSSVSTWPPRPRTNGARAIAGLAAAGLVTETDGQWRRGVIEKPFGHDLHHAHTARLLDRHCDLILVGDSLGMVMHGLETTVPEHDGLPALAGRGCR